MSFFLDDRRDCSFVQWLSLQLSFAQSCVVLGSAVCRRSTSDVDNLPLPTKALRSLVLMKEKLRRKETRFFIDIIEFCLNALASFVIPAVLRKGLFSKTSRISYCGRSSLASQIVRIPCLHSQHNSCLTVCTSSSSLSFVSLPSLCRAEILEMFAPFSHSATLNSIFTAAKWQWNVISAQADYSDLFHCHSELRQHK